MDKEKGEDQTTVNKVARLKMENQIRYWCVHKWEVSVISLSLTSCRPWEAQEKEIREATNYLSNEIDYYFIWFIVGFF